MINFVVAVVRCRAPFFGVEHKTKGHEKKLRQKPLDKNIKVGSLIRAGPPGKRTQRNYRVDSQSLDYSSGAREYEITLREMWRRDSDRTWVVSKKMSRLNLSSLLGVSNVNAIAPEAGSKE